MNYEDKLSEEFLNQSSKNSELGSVSMAITKIGAKTALGAGIGIAIGCIGAVVAVQMLEMAVPALLVAKVSGVVGGTAGMVVGLNDAERKRAKILCKGC